MCWKVVRNAIEKAEAEDARSTAELAELAITHTSEALKDAGKGLAALFGCEKQPFAPTPDGVPAFSEPRNARVQRAVEAAVAAICAKQKSGWRPR
jgi:hypothetical protein